VDGERAREALFTVLGAPPVLEPVPPAAGDEPAEEVQPEADDPQAAQAP